MEILLRALGNIKDLIRKADNEFWESMYYTSPEPNDLIDYYIETAFIFLLSLVDKLELYNIYEKINYTYKKAQKNFHDSKMGMEEPYLVWGEFLRTYIDAIANTYGISFAGETVITENVESILRQSIYSITDSELFPAPPVDENEVHKRIEGVLKCIFPDLKHKPTLTKQIKNFEPDTGIPSIRTLIEYKFIAKRGDVKKIVDELLADTRGYHSKDWKYLYYVIYETRRFMSEKEWNQLFNQCGVGENTKVIVICGEPVKPKIKKTCKKIK